jgi:hypothetical protein
MIQSWSNKEKKERDRKVSRPYQYEGETLCLMETPHKHVVMKKYLRLVGVS